MEQSEFNFGSSKKEDGNKETSLNFPPQWETSSLGELEQLLDQLEAAVRKNPGKLVEIAGYEITDPLKAREDLRKFVENLQKSYRRVYGKDEGEENVNQPPPPHVNPYQEPSP